MKIQHFFYILLAITLFSSCKKEPATPTDTDMSLSVRGGESFEVEDGNVTKDIFVSCSSPAKRDIIVNLESNATQSEAELLTNQVTIKKGTKTAGTAIVFKIDAFPEKSPEKIILVRISTRTKDVIVEGISTEFTVKRFIPLVLDTETNGETFNTFNEDAKFTLTLTLSKLLKEELVVNFTLKEESSPVFKELFKEIADVKIKAGDLKAEQTFTIPRGTEGALGISMQTTNADVKLTTSDFTAVFTAESMTN